MYKILDITPDLTETDCFRIVSRHKNVFTYPAHRHKVIELNFVEDGRGARRTIRDNSEEIGDYDLVMVGENLEHFWEQGNCVSSDIRELTVHFHGNLFQGNFEGKKQFEPITRMLKEANKGISFNMKAVLSVYSLLNQLVDEQDGFEQVLIFEKILYLLSCSNYRTLVKVSAELPDFTSASDGINLAKEFMKQNFGGRISLDDVAKAAGMPPTTLGRIFKMRTETTVMSYLIQIRLQEASRKLVDTTKRIADIAKECGFGNLSNFNRAFKSTRGKTPLEYRHLYYKFKRNV